MDLFGFLLLVEGLDSTVLGQLRAMHCGNYMDHFNNTIFASMVANSGGRKANIAFRETTGWFEFHTMVLGNIFSAGTREASKLAFLPNHLLFYIILHCFLFDLIVNKVTSSYKSLNKDTGNCRRVEKLSNPIERQSMRLFSFKKHSTMRPIRVLRGHI